METPGKKPGRPGGNFQKLRFCQKSALAGKRDQPHLTKNKKICLGGQTAQRGPTPFYKNTKNTIRQKSRPVWHKYAGKAGISQKHKIWQKNAVTGQLEKSQKHKIWQTNAMIWQNLPWPADGRTNPILQKYYGKSSSLKITKFDKKLAHLAKVRARLRNWRFVETKRPIRIGVDVSPRRNAHSTSFQTPKR